MDFDALPVYLVFALLVVDRMVALCRSFVGKTSTAPLAVVDTAMIVKVAAMMSILERMLVMIAEIQRENHELLVLHNVRDSHGNPVWYASKELAISLKELRKEMTLLTTRVDILTDTIAKAA